MNQKAPQKVIQLKVVILIFRGRDDDKLDYIIIHVTAGINYGNDPVSTINQEHINRGFAGIGYHFLIGRGAEGNDNSPEGTLYGARPDNKIGAHTLGHNSRSLGVSMIANCDKIGVYGKDEGGDHPTRIQKETLEWTLFVVII